MTRLPNLNALARGTLVANADLLYRHTGAFTLGGSTWANTRFSVKDPDKLRPDALAQLQARAVSLGLAYTDLRVLTVHPDDTLPYVNATLPWDDGTLQVLDWSQVSDFTGTRQGTAVLRRP